MTTFVTEGTCLATLVKMALPIFQQAEQQFPRTGPGRKPLIPDWLSERVSFGEKIDKLGSQVRYVLADSGYDNNQYGDRIEWDGEGRRTGKRFLCPEKPRGRTPKKRRDRQRSATALTRRQAQRRQARQKFLRSRRGRKLFARRSQTVEPFNDWFKALFELNHAVWHRGLGNNRTQLLAAIFAYQVLLRYNYCCGKKNGQVRWILDML